MRALITGGGGQLAHDLVALLGDDAHALAHDQLDICDDGAVTSAYRELDPDVVINCAAFHNVDVCERDAATAFAVNVEAVRGLARRAAPLVHVSTNYVFDGRREQAYAEHDLPAPRSVYALTKLAGEHAALAYGDEALVVRTAGLYGIHGNASKGGNFVQRVLARAREEGAVRMVADQRLQPTFTADLAVAIVEAVQAKVSGVVHLTASGACSWYEFTCAIMENAGLDVDIEPAETVRTADGPDRPLNGVLAHDRARALGLVPLRQWREALDAYMQAAGLLAGAAAAGGR